MSEVWSQVLICLREIRANHGTVCHSLVLMRNHCHILLSCQHANNLDLALQKMLIELKTTLNIEAPFREPIRSYPQLKQTYKYIYANPIQAGLCDSAEKYPFSSLRQLLGLPSKEVSPTSIEIIDNMNLISDPIRTLSWLNSSNTD